MAIEQFTTAEFEAALPVGAWESLGLIQGEQSYFVKPSDAPPGYGVMVRSSIGSSGIADDCGEDSIRCLLCKKDGNGIKIIGNKAKRWTTRVKGWQGRMMELLRHCKGQLSRIRPCPLCAAPLVPFTSHKKESKGRGFVSCRNPDCGKFFEWCDEPIKQVETPTGKIPTPNCPKCNSLMSRMSSGKGWRCAVAGNRWSSGKWSKCDGVIWDEVKSNKTPLQGRGAVFGDLNASEKFIVSSVQSLVNRMGGHQWDRARVVTALASVEVLDLLEVLMDANNVEAERLSAAMSERTLGQ